MDNMEKLQKIADLYNFSLYTQETQRNVSLRETPNPLLFSGDNYIKFNNVKNVQITENSQTLEYINQERNNTVVHWGQLKLMLAQIQFINNYWDPAKSPNPKIVYIGAAPGSWWPLFAEMYPNFEIHLYDPAPFDVKIMEWDNTKENSSKMYVYNRLFIDEDVKKWKYEEDVFFVSDIRNSGYNHDPKRMMEMEKLIQEDMTRQMDWVIEMDPFASQLKFRIPFYVYNDPNRDNKYMYEYLNGIVYYQSWVGATSSETRLVSTKPYKKINYNAKLYESMINHHNIEVRSLVITKFFNPFDGSTDAPSSRLGLYNDWDSISTIYTLKEYIEKTSIEDEEASEEEVLSLFNKIDKYTGDAAQMKRRMQGMRTKTLNLLVKRQEL